MPRPGPRPPVPFVLISLAIALAASAAAPAHAGDPADSQYRFAMMLSGRDELARAARELERFIREFADDPRRPDAEFFLAYTYIKMTRHKEAEALLNKWLRAHPAHRLAEKAKYWLGEALSRTGQVEAARSAWERVVREHPDGARTPEALDALAWSYRESSEWEKALARARELVDKFPDRKALVDRGLRLSGDCLLALGRPAEALKSYDKLLGREPAKDLRFEARFGRASALRAEGRALDAAREFAGLAVEARREPTERAGRVAAEAAVAAADVMLSEGRSAEALAALSKTKSVKAELWRAVALSALDRLGEAERLLAHVLSRPDASPLHGRAAWELAQVRYKAGDRVGALAAYETASRRGDPDTSARALYNAAVMLSELGRGGEALKRFEGFAERLPKHQLAPEAVYASAEILLGLGRLEEAASRYGEFVSRPGRGADAARIVEAHLRVAWCLLALDRLEEAGRQLEKFDSISAEPPPSSRQIAEARFLFGETQRRLGRGDEARKAYSEALAKGLPTERRAEALWALSALAEKRGESEEALELAGELVKKHPDFPLLPWAHLTAARSALALGKADVAAEHARAALDAAKEDDEVRIAAAEVLARALEKSGDADGAVRAYMKLYRLRPRSGDAPIRAARLIRRTRGAEHAREFLNRFLDSMPKEEPPPEVRAPALLELAAVLEELGDLDGALGRLRELKERFASGGGLHEAEALRREAVIQFKRGDREAERGAWTELLVRFDRLVRSSARPFPQGFDAHWGLAALEEEDLNFRKAAELYGRAASQDPSRAVHALTKAAGCRIALGEHAEALPLLREALEVEAAAGPRAEAEALLAGCLIELGHHEEALGVFETREGGVDPRILPLLARAKRLSGKADEALALALEFLKGRRERPRHIVLEAGLAAKALGKEEAEGLLREVLRGGDDEPAARARLALGGIFLKRGEREEAERAFYQVLLLYPDGTWKDLARLELGELAERSGETGRARGFYAELVRKAHDPKNAAEARERLEKLAP